MRRSDQLGGIGSKRRLFLSHYHNERINPSLSQIYPTLFKKSILCRKDVAIRGNHAANVLPHSKCCLRLTLLCGIAPPERHTAA